MPVGDVVVENLWKTFRIYHQRSSTLKQAVLRRGNDVFDEFWALRDVSFEVPAGITLGLIGANGAGKSTMLKVLSKILVPDPGAVHVNGRVSALLELGAGFHPELSGRENVFLNGTILGMSQSDLERRFDEIVAFAGLEHAIDNAVKTYSSGMQARLGFAVAVSIEPDILIIDEVLAVGDEQFQRRCLERITELRSGGRTAIFVSHGLGQVQQICDRVVWLDKGTVAADGDTESVINAYLRSVSGSGRIDEWGRERDGSGELQIDAAFAVDGVGTTSLVSGQPATVTLWWECESPIDHALVRFEVRASDGAVIAGQQLQDQFVDRIERGNATIRYHIPALMLLPGAYHLSVGVYDRHSGHVYDSCVHELDFDVVPGEPQHDSLGRVALGGRWEHHG